MHRRTLARVSTLAIVTMTPALSLSGSASAAQSTGHQRFERLAVPAGLTYTPAMARAAAGDAKFIVRLQAKSVGAQIAEARQQHRSLSKADRAALRAQVADGQQGVIDTVGRLGGHVDYRYQDALNGLAVRVPASSVADLAAAPGVASVEPVHTLERNDVAGNQFIGTPSAWQSTGKTGDGVKIAIIDTGVDYTHADFGGPGTVAAFTGNDGTIIEPGSFPTAKVIGGRDYVGDAYNAGDADHDVPQPDPDPLDCDGHGSHVAGIAAGEGVLADGTTYPGPYDDTTYTNTFNVGPGIAPEASILAYRVFGCKGTVDSSIVIEALNQALVDDADVVNMSLGSPFGRSDSDETATVDTLSAAGVTVVASAGNNGPNAYVTGAPAAADSAISVAAMDATSPTIPGAHVAGAASLNMQLSNDVDFTEGQSLQVKVLRDTDGSVSLGCDPAAYIAAGVTGKLVVVQRGTCARTARAIFGQQAGAAAVAMVNSTSDYPPVEGQITENPDTGEKYTVTIPFFGVRGVLGPSATADGDNLVAADGGTVTLTHAGITNPGYQKFASFSSGGPRNGDSAVKPDVTAPGVSILSAGVGTGVRAATISGTSQASPATAGVAALVTQAHPDWTPEQIKAAIVSTADPTLLANYNVRVGGAGVVQPRRAVDSVVLPLAGHSQSSLSFGYAAARGAWSQTLPLTLQNTSGSDVDYTLAPQFQGSSLGAGVTIVPSAVTVPANGTTTVDVTMTLTAAAVAALPPATTSNFGPVVSIRGAVVATPTSSGTGVYSLRVPFVAVPRGLSSVTAAPAAKPVSISSTLPLFSTDVAVTNSGAHDGDADVYAWGISDANDVADAAEDATDVRAVGVQVFPDDTGTPEDDTFTVFAVNTYGRWSNPGSQEVDIAIDSNRDGRPDAYIVGFDYGYLTTGQFDGRYAAFVTDADFNVVDIWIPTAPMNSSTMEFGVPAAELGLAAGQGPFRYAVATGSVVPGGLGDSTSWASFDAYDPSVSTGAYASLPVGASDSLSLTFDQSKVGSQRTLGWMVVSTDDDSGAASADTVAVPTGAAVHKPPRH